MVTLDALTFKSMTWLDDCLNDVYDAVDEDNRDDKLALLFESNKENKVAINTTVGQIR